MGCKDKIIQPTDGSFVFTQYNQMHLLLQLKPILLWINKNLKRLLATTYLCSIARYLVHYCRIRCSLLLAVHLEFGLVALHYISVSIPINNRHIIIVPVVYAKKTHSIERFEDFERYRYKAAIGLSHQWYIGWHTIFHFTTPDWKI